MDKRTAIHHAIVCMSVIEKIVPGYYPDGMLEEPDGSFTAPLPGTAAYNFAKAEGMI